MSSEVSTSEFLAHCEAAPEPCKEKVLAYVKFLADGGLLNRCIMQLPADNVAANLIRWMGDHPEYAEKDWVDCIDDAISTPVPFVKSAPDEALAETIPPVSRDRGAWAVGSGEMRRSGPKGP